MTSLRLALPDGAQPPQTPRQASVVEDLSAGAQELLTCLRRAALACRTKARTDLFKACAMLALDKVSARDAYANALMRCLPQALGKNAIVYRPGVLALSFDESWILQLVRTVQTGDVVSQRFLLDSRIAPHDCRNILFLIASIAEQTDLD